MPYTRSAEAKAPSKKYFIADSSESSRGRAMPARTYNGRDNNHKGRNTNRKHAGRSPPPKADAAFVRRTPQEGPHSRRQTGGCEEGRPTLSPARDEQINQ